jgi:hypothetical protein
LLTAYSFFLPTAAADCRYQLPLFFHCLLPPASLSFIAIAIAFGAVISQKLAIWPIMSAKMAFFLLLLSSLGPDSWNGAHWPWKRTWARVVGL